MYKSSGGKSMWVLPLFILAGVVAGGFLGNTLVTFANNNNIGWFDWLIYGPTLKIGPVEFDLIIISGIFGLTLDFTISGILGMVAAIFIYRKLKI